jgi:hypothetical protein
MRPKSCTTGREGEGEVGTKEGETGRGSPVNANGGGVSGLIGERSEALASEANGPIPGKMGEVVACLSTCEKERSERRAGRWSVPF